MHLSNKIFLLFFVVFFFIISGYLYQDNIFATRFVDEEYNLAIGKYLTQNEILYKDIITNHQPITHILSSSVQRLRTPNNVYSLILWHREFVFLWSFFWATILVLRFGWKGFFFVIIYELTKSNLFGNLFLAEAISVYPLIFLIGQILIQKRQWMSWEIITAGFSLSFLSLCLGPLWPTLGFLLVLLLYHQRDKIKSTLFYLLAGSLCVILPILKFISVYGYLKIYLLFNLIYTVPSQTNTYYPEGWYLTIFKALFSPILSFTNNDTDPFIWVIRTLSLLFIISLIFLIHHRKYFQSMIYFFLLGLTNLRFIDPAIDSYMRFHLLPWYGSLIFITLLLFTDKIKGIYILLVSYTFIFTLIYMKSDIAIIRNPQKDFEINFSTHQNRGNVIKILSDANDTLFVSPDAWLVYWQSDANHIPGLFGYYAWMAGIPEIHQKIFTSFEKTPPTFFYCENCKGLDLEKYLAKYRQLHSNEGLSMLYILEEKIPKLTARQTEQLKFYGFTVD